MKSLLKTFLLLSVLLPGSVLFAETDFFEVTYVEAENKNGDAWGRWEFKFSGELKETEHIEFKWRVAEIVGEENGYRKVVGSGDNFFPNNAIPTATELNLATVTLDEKTTSTLSSTTKLSGGQPEKKNIHVFKKFGDAKILMTEKSFILKQNKQLDMLSFTGVVSDFDPNEKNFILTLSFEKRTKILFED